jgi:hypothetical protein
MATVPAWRGSIQRLLQEYPAITSKFLTLATVDEHNKPRARYVVFRQWHDDNSLIVVSDNRHSKVWSSTLFYLHSALSLLSFRSAILPTTLILKFVGTSTTPDYNTASLAKPMSSPAQHLLLS